jgi:hypothetical protein
MSPERDRLEDSVDWPSTAVVAVLVSMIVMTVMAIVAMRVAHWLATHVSIMAP